VGAMGELAAEAGTLATSMEQDTGGTRSQRGRCVASYAPRSIAITLVGESVLAVLRTSGSYCA
jgi:hypothetical protein